MNEADTKTRLLDAAEKLFAEKGIDATSIRDITSAAGTNPAAVNYHFRSKEALVEAVYVRRIRPVNRMRLELLDEVEARAGAGGPSLEQIVDASIGPVLREYYGTSFMALMGRMYVEPGDLPIRIIGEQMREVARRFGGALRRALPGLSEQELYWRMNFAIGGLLHTLAGTKLLEFISDGKCGASDVETIRERIVTFVCAGLRAGTGGYA